MNKLLLAAALACIAGAAQAQTVDDPLHLCYASPNDCTPFNNIHIGTLGQGASGWGISSSPAGAEGHLVIAILVPQNEAEITLPTLTGTLNGNPLGGIGAVTDVALFGPGQDLTTVLGINAAPPNPYDAYSAATAALDPGFVNGTSGYVVLEVSVAGNTFQTGSTGGLTNILNNDFSLNGGSYIDPFLPGDPTESGLPAGTILTAFIEGANGNISTAQSSSLALNPLASPVPEPSTWIMALGGFGLVGLIGLRKRRVSRFAV